MAQYGIGLSALNAFSEAIDVTSNNIANGQTVGYKSAEYVFADQFFKAQNPQSRDRAGMGTSRMIIRRANTYGTITGTQNPLDLAIAGPGMFTLAKTKDGVTPTETPQKFQYTRNGQFAVDSEKRIVNENGLYLVGYAADSQGNVITSTKSTLKLDDSALPQVPTKNSYIDINIDNRAVSLAGRKFDRMDPTGYSQATSQTVYDDKGTSHTLTMYYKKVNSNNLVLTQDGTTTTFSYSVNQELGTTQNGEQTSKIANTASEATGTIPTASLTSTVLTYLSGGLEGDNGVKTLTGAFTSAGTPRDGIYKDVKLTGATSTAANAYGTVTVSGNAVTAIEITATGSGYSAAETLNFSFGPNGAYSGTAVIAADVAGGRSSSASGDGKLGAVYELKLNDGTLLTVKRKSFASVTSSPLFNVEVDRYAVFASLDGIPIGSTSAGTGETNIKISGATTAEQTSIGTLAFVAGKNIDSLAKDANLKSQFNTKLTLAATGGSGSTWGKTTNGGLLSLSLFSSDTTAYSSVAQTYKNSQDGSATAQLSSYSFDAYGKLVAQYDNGKSVVKGQLLLATFNNFEGLIPVGGNGFMASSASGDPLYDTPNGSQLGAIRSQAYEESNVDLTQQLVKLMVLQRAYSAASQATKVQVATLVDDTLRIGQ